MIDGSLFLKNDGSLWVSGINEYGKVGAGEINEYIGLTKIVESGVAGISASSANHSIYLRENGDVYTFGSNFDGQLVIGRTISNWEKQTIYDPNE